MAFILLGCETTPQTSSQKSITPSKIPSSFLGTAGVEYVPASFKIVGDGVYKKGEVFAEKEFRITRVGVLQNDITVHDGLDRHKFMQGDKLYAIQIRDPNEETENLVSTVAWCKPSVVRIIISKSEIPICVLWGNEKKAAYLVLRISKNPYWDYNMGFFGTDPVFADVPIIADGDYELDVTLKMQLVFQKIKKKDYKFRLKLSDGTRETVYRTDGVFEQRGGNSIFKIWGGEFLVKTVNGSKEDTVSIALIKEPDDLEPHELNFKPEQDKKER